MAILKEKGIKHKSSAPHARRLLHFLARRKKTISPLLILTHDYPDPDAIASAFALQYLAEQRYGIQSKIVYGGVIGRMENRMMVHLLKIPIHKVKPADFRKYQHTALLDTQPGFENNSLPKDKRATIVIDQHAFVKKPAADLVVVDTECAATCVILAQALLLSKIQIPVRIATALAYGIISDTLNLYRADKSNAVETYLKILPHCDLRALALIQNPWRSRKFFVTVGKGIQEAMVRRKLIVTHLGHVENPDLVSQVADFLLTYRHVKWSFCTGRYNHKLYASLRTETPNVETGEMLRDIFINRGDAGGRGPIAGGSFRVGRNLADDIWKAIERGLTVRLLKRLRIPQRGNFVHPFRQKRPVHSIGGI